MELTSCQILLIDIPCSSFSTGRLSSGTNLPIAAQIPTRLPRWDISRASTFRDSPHCCLSLLQQWDDPGIHSVIFLFKITCPYIFSAALSSESPSIIFIVSLLVCLVFFVLRETARKKDWTPLMLRTDLANLGLLNSVWPLAQKELTVTKG